MAAQPQLLLVPSSHVVSDDDGYCSRRGSRRHVLAGGHKRDGRERRIETCLRLRACVQGRRCACVAPFVRKQPPAAGSSAVTRWLLRRGSSCAARVETTVCSGRTRKSPRFIGDQSVPTQTYRGAGSASACYFVKPGLSRRGGNTRSGQSDVGDRGNSDRTWLSLCLGRAWANVPSA